MSYSLIGKICNKIISKKKIYYPSFKQSTISYDYYLDEDGNAIINKGINVELNKQKLKNFLIELSKSDEKRNIERKKLLKKLTGEKNLYLFEKKNKEYIEIRNIRTKNILKQRHDEKINDVIYRPNYQAIYPSIHMTIFPKSYEKVNNHNIDNSNDNSNKTKLNSCPKNLKKYHINSEHKKLIPIEENNKFNLNKNIEDNIDINSKNCINNISKENINNNTNILGNKSLKLINKNTENKYKNKYNVNLNKNSKSSSSIFKNKKSIKFKPLEAFYSYSPNYDYIKEDTTKSFVHYNREQEKDIRHKKITMTKKKIYNIKLLNSFFNEYEVINICNEEKKKKENKRKNNSQNILLNYKNIFNL